MLREARAANRVDHAHIIDIHDIGETDDSELYLVMEYLVGTPLSAELARGPLPLSRAVDILEQMGAALSRAHDLGVVHRDLKSDNILLTARGGRKDFVKILDFGLAALAHDPRLAPKGAVFGTPEYMSPEQARGEQAGPQSDLYALGVLFFEMLTGQLPFRAGDRETLLEMQRTSQAPRPTSVKKDCHPVCGTHRPALAGKRPAQALPRWSSSARGAEGAPAILAEHLMGQGGRHGRLRRTASGGSATAPSAKNIGSWRVGHASWPVRSHDDARLPSNNAPAEVSQAVAAVWDMAAKANGFGR
jgi:serine/threonine-protein kinase